MSAKADGLDLAEPGDVCETLAMEIEVYQAFLDDRRRLFMGLFGRNLRYSWVRERIAREAVVACARRRDMKVSDYVKIIGREASAATVRSEIAILELCGLVRLVHEGRATWVRPTKKLTGFYETQMPRLWEEIAKRMPARSPGMD